MEDKSKEIELRQLEYGESKIRITCVESDGVRMVPLAQISSHLLPPMSQPTLEKRLKQLGDTLTRRKATRHETQLLKDNDVIAPRAFPPWLIPFSNLDDILPFLQSGGRCASSSKPKGDNRDPDVRSDELKRRLARALCRLESDFHDASPLSVKSIGSSTGVRASSMRAGFYSSHFQDVSVASCISHYDKHSIADEVNGFHTCSLRDLPKNLSPVEDEVCSSMRVYGKLALSDIQREASDGESDEAIIDISNDCESSALPLSHCLWDLDYIEENGYSDLMETDECVHELDDPDFTLNSKKWIRTAKGKRRRILDGKESKQMNVSSDKTLGLLVNRTESVEDHATMKREYDALNQHSIDNFKNVKSSLKAKLEKKTKRKRAKQLLDRAHKCHRTKALSQQKQPVKSVTKEQDHQHQQSSVESSSKPTEVPDVRIMKVFRPFSSPRNGFCLKDAIPGRSLLMVDDNGELNVRYSNRTESSQTAMELPPLSHPIWNWQVGQPFSKNSKTIVIRRVKLTTVPLPSQDPTKSRSKPRKHIKPSRKKLKYSSLGIP